MTTDSLRIYIGHVDEIHYVSTSEMPRRYTNSETNKDKKNQGTQNLEHVREIKRKSFTKWKAANPEHVREINKQSVRKRKINNPECVREINKQSFRKRKADKPDLVRETKKTIF